MRRLARWFIVDDPAKETKHTAAEAQAKKFARRYDESGQMVVILTDVDPKTADGATWAGWKTTVRALLAVT